MGTIYKITSPSYKIYIGQTIDVNRRFKQYKRLNFQRQTKLYYSLKKYGHEKHIFEIIEECDISLLNERERYWQDFYNVLSERGLNCILTETNTRSGKISDEVKLKISKANKGRVLTKEHKEKLSLANINGKNKKCKKVVCMKTGEEWLSAKLAAIDNNFNYNTLMKRLNGILKNNTTLKYLENV